MSRASTCNNQKWSKKVLREESFLPSEGKIHSVCSYSIGIRLLAVLFSKWCQGISFAYHEFIQMSIKINKKIIKSNAVWFNYHLMFQLIKSNAVLLSNARQLRSVFSWTTRINLSMIDLRHCVKHKNLWLGSEKAGQNNGHLHKFWVIQYWRQ